MAVCVRRRKSAGFTLVELMITVAIIGVLAALAIFGVKHYMAAAHSAEAKEAVGAIARGAALAYEREVAAAVSLPEGANGSQVVNNFCGSAADVPDTLVKVQGVKYQPITANGSDFFSGDYLNGWICLNYAKSEPIMYQYSYTAKGVAGPNSVGYVGPGLGGPNPGGNGFEAAAQGDLDADGSIATFARSGKVSAVSSELTLSTQVFVDNEAE